jgi:hypothetical protein
MSRYSAEKGPVISHLRYLLLTCCSRSLKFMYLFYNSVKVDTEYGARGGVVVKALRYKPAGRGFDSQCCNWNFSVTQCFRSHYGPGVDAASNRNEYHVYFLGVKAAGA